MYYGIHISVELGSGAHYHMHWPGLANTELESCACSRPLREWRTALSEDVLCTQGWWWA